MSLGHDPIADSPLADSGALSGGDFVDASQIVTEILSHDDGGTDYIEASQIVTEVLSHDDGGTAYIDASQVVVEVLVFRHIPIYARLDSATDGFKVRLDSATDGFKIKLGD